MKTLRALVASCRPAQWIKNAACFAGLIFAGRLGDAGARLLALRTFAAFCLASSAVYLLNDLMDRDADRASPSKRRRPIAAGDLSPGAAVGAALLLAAGAAWTARAVNAPLLALLGGYLALNLAYSWRLKEVPVLDVLCIAAGFSIRVHAGVAGIGAPPSLWMLLCMFSLALFIGFGKRRAEMNEEGARPVLARYGREGLDRLLLASAVLASASYALFCASGRHGMLMLASAPPVPFVLWRYRRALTARAYSPPEEFLLKDLPSLSGLVLWLASCLWVLYGQGRVPS